MRASTIDNIFYFDKFDPFTKKNADKIINFNSELGHKIAFNELAFPGLKNQDTFTFAVAENKKGLKAASRQDNDIVYYEKKGFLYYDGNGSKNNWGKKNVGGLFAKINKGLDLTTDDFIFYVI